MKNPGFFIESIPVRAGQQGQFVVEKVENVEVVEC